MKILLFEFWFDYSFSCLLSRPSYALSLDESYPSSTTPASELEKEAPQLEKKTEDSTLPIGELVDPTPPKPLAGGEGETRTEDATSEPLGKP